MHYLWFKIYTAFTLTFPVLWHGFAEDMEGMEGDGDRETKSVNFLVESLSQNAPSLGLSEGKQNRDWIYIEDVLAAYEVILQNISQFEQGKCYGFEIGTGQRTGLKEFVITAKDLAGSNTDLLFGKARMHKNERITEHERKMS